MVSGMHGHDQILKATMSTAVHCRIVAVGAFAVYVRTCCVHRFGGKGCRYGHRRPDHHQLCTLQYAPDYKMVGLFCVCRAAYVIQIDLMQFIRYYVQANQHNLNHYIRWVSWREAIIWPEACQTKGGRVKKWERMRMDDRWRKEGPGQW